MIVSNYIQMVEAFSGLRACDETVLKYVNMIIIFVKN